MTRSINKTWFGSASVAALMIASSGTANAQGADDEVIGLEEIIITAERRAASLQDVPVAVTALTASEMRARQIDEPLDIIDYVPNLFGANNTGLGSANTYYLRGLGNTESIATFDPPVGTYVDEVISLVKTGTTLPSLMWSVLRFCVDHKAPFLAGTPLVVQSLYT